MGRPKKGRCVKKNLKALYTEPEELIRAPHSIVISRGLNGGHVNDLTTDFRRVMEPFTASSLKVRKKNTSKDFLSVAGVLHVSHLLTFSHTINSTFLKIARMPRGPTLSFKIHSFSLSRDVISSLKKQFVFEEAFHHAPLVVLNSFSGEGIHLKLMTTTFQNMFPTINLTNVQLSTIRRCVLLNYNPETKLIDFRHYAIKAVPIGLSKGVKKVVQGKVPNLSKCNDISEFITKAGMLSESEFEDDETGAVTLPQKLSSRGNHRDNKSAIRLYELGPRITMQLIKVEDGFNDGQILFHELIVKTDEEKAHIEKMRADKKKLKESRRKVQESNKAKKDLQKEELKQKSLAGMAKTKLKETDRLMERAVNEANENVEYIDDDAQYYQDEVGAAPDKDLFNGSRLPSKKLFKIRPRTNKPKPDSKKESNFDRSKNDTFKNKNGFTIKNKKLTNGGRFNKNRNENSKKTGGRGGNPKYGWRAQNSEDNSNSKEGFNKSNKFGKKKSFKRN